ncbi:MAG TPA: hydroxymethylglutaryl-CoA lyase [Candidatus Sulfomarinibacteraceae bacterium]|nr:hydroxymethylglutaryl-CoA lyase [Candidatus Sulfomarinibacteraceae bacterium]
MNNLLQVYEVGPRDGLQNEPAHVSTEEKLRLIDLLVAAGLPRIEATSFVHPKAVPQMADADEVMSHILNKYEARPVTFVGLVLNEHGYDRAYEAGCRHMALGVAVSETFSQRNTNMSTKEALEICRRLSRRAEKDGVWTRTYLMTAWVCPFEGPMLPRKSLGYARQVWDMGIDELAVADTIGHADPVSVGRLLEQIGRYTGMDNLAAHLHDTQALGLANCSAALSAGVRTFDSSVGGLGGCPFAPGAAGNLATEDLVFLAYKMGLGTGVDFSRLWEAVAVADELTGRRTGGRIRDWWESHAEKEPTLSMM